MKCRGKECGADIKFISVNGRKMPVDSEQTMIVVPDKNFPEVGSMVKGHMPHWVTCPDADEFRRRKKGEKRRYGK